MKRGFVGSVESVRGLAALFVALSHTMGFILVAHYLTPVFNVPRGRELTYYLIGALVNGQMAVTVFFVISGFVIGRSLDAASGAGAAGRSYVVFLVRRFLRLYPAQIAAVIGITGLAWLFFMGRPAIDFTALHAVDADTAEQWLNGRVFNPLKLKSVLGNLALATWSMNLVTWSLYVEVCVAPLLPLFHKISRANAGQGWRDAAVVAGLIALSVLVWGWLWIEYWFAFYLGMVVETRGRAWASLVREKLGGPGLAIAVSYLVMITPAMLTQDRPPIVSIVEAFCAFSIISLIVWSEPGRIARVLDHPVLRWNGRLSYSFYLWHYIIVTIAVRELYATFSPEIMRAYELPLFAATVIGTVAAALGVAQLSYSFIEVPFIAFGRRWAGTRAPPRVPQVAPAPAATRAPDATPSPGAVWAAAPE